LRTYRAHKRGSGPLDDPGEQDITADVVLEQLDAASPFVRLRTERQAEWLDALGIGELVEDGRRAWEAGAAEGGLDALAGRSRISEAAALTDPAGLGAHRVVLFGAGGAGRDFTW
jgi:SAM-dependent MidA family methyltransferase